MRTRIVCGLAFVFLALVSYVVYDLKNLPSNFIEDAFHQLGGGGGRELEESYQLESGESYRVILAYSCCGGVGFDAVAIQTSGGERYSSQKNYCGYEGFCGELTSHNIKDLNSLHTYLTAEGFQVH